jgi:putative ABC transport system substrate-binding protein
MLPLWLKAAAMQFGQLRRRQFLGVLGGAAVAWPLVAQAQQPAVPIIGYLNPGGPDAVTRQLAVFRQALAETGYVEGQNVAIDYRFASGRSDLLPELAADLVRRRVAMIVAAPAPAALAAKGATASIPIVFGVGGDPVGLLGLVSSIARPGGNATGAYYFLAELAAKNLGFLRELVPTATRIGLLINPTNPGYEPYTRDVMAAASATGVQIDIVHATNSQEIETAFTTLVRNKVDALVVAPESLFFNRRLPVAMLAVRHGIPAIYALREYAEAGGLMSYGTSLTEVYRQMGLYAGRILKGTKPADLPVVQSTKSELVINLPAARTIGLKFPPTLLAIADEVIE